jgi:hypothetical protein
MAASNNLRRNNMISVNKGEQFNALADNLLHSIYAWTFVHRVNILPQDYEGDAHFAQCCN